MAEDASNKELNKDMTANRMTWNKTVHGQENAVGNYLDFLYIMRLFYAL